MNPYSAPIKLKFRTGQMLDMSKDPNECGFSHVLSLYFFRTHVTNVRAIKAQKYKQL